MDANELLTYRVREAAGEPEGALVVFHGRGADEHDIFPLLGALDPERRLVGYTPRGPLSLPPGGAHWYALGGFPTPEPRTFWSTWGRVTAWLDSLPVPPERTILGGFSQGAVMTYALSLARDRSRPAAAIALSGFMPEVEGLELDAANAPPFAIGHGAYDDVISVEWSRRAKAALEGAGADVLYRESPYPHAVDPIFVPELQQWLRRSVDRVGAVREEA